MPVDPVPEAIQLDAELTALSEPDVSELWRVMHGYGPEAIGAAAAKIALEGGGGGGSQPVQLLGPFTFVATDFGGNGGNFPEKVIDLATGTMVLQVFGIVTTGFDGDSPALGVGVAPTADLTNSDSIGQDLDLTVAQVRPTYAKVGGMVTGDTSITQTVSLGASSLIVWLNFDPGAPTVGSVDVYALLNIPASP
jgi:hypothetical protein